MTHETTDEKAVRLLQEQRLHPAVTSRVYISKGDTETYVTTILCIGGDDEGRGWPFAGTCTCEFGTKQKQGERAMPIRKACSHVKAGAGYTVIAREMEE